jgi:hypothetical protein
MSGSAYSTDIGKDAQALAFSRITTHPPLKLWPFPLYTAFPGSEYDGRADSLWTHWRFLTVVSNPLLPLSFASFQRVSQVPPDGLYAIV